MTTTPDYYTPDAPEERTRQRREFFRSWLKETRAHVDDAKSHDPRERPRQCCLCERKTSDDLHRIAATRAWICNIPHS